MDYQKQLVMEKNSQYSKQSFLNIKLHKYFKDK